MMKIMYSIESEKLVARTKNTQEIKWESDFGPLKIFKILPLENDKGCLVLLDPGSSDQPTFENLLLIRPSGDLYWKAQLPRTNDAFADVLRTGSQIEARTWNGIRVRVDMETGRTVEIGFSK